MLNLFKKKKPTRLKPEELALFQQIVALELQVRHTRGLFMKMMQARYGGDLKSIAPEGGQLLFEQHLNGQKKE